MVAIRPASFTARKIVPEPTFAAVTHDCTEQSVYVGHILNVMARDPLENCTGFDWDEYNSEKNRERHRVTPEEAEDVFFHEPIVVRSDVRHSKREKRYYALGQTSAGRMLFVAFTIRRELIRVISVRDMNRSERAAYGRKETEKDS